MWRSSPRLPVKEYELCTVTYGTVPASFQAPKCLEVIADEIADSEPVAAEAIKTNFYMDDFLKSVPTLEEACRLRCVVHGALASAGFRLRKYVSNSRELLATVDREGVAVTPVELLPETRVTVLGLIWEPDKDEFCVKLNLPILVDEKVTKRLILSFTARIFDPLGFLAPFVIRFKVLLQKIWAEKFEWDEIVSVENGKEFSELTSTISVLSSFSIQRPYSLKGKVIEQKLIGFCDASERAYCAVLYLKSSCDDGSSDVYMISAKTKIAPVVKLNRAPSSEENITIHRLELMTATLLTELTQRVSGNLNLSLENADVFSDSQVTLLGWLAKKPEFMCVIA